MGLVQGEALARRVEGVAERRPDQGVRSKKENEALMNIMPRHGFKYCMVLRFARIQHGTGPSARRALSNFEAWRRAIVVHQDFGLYYVVVVVTTTTRGKGLLCWTDFVRGSGCVTMVEDLMEA